MESSVSIRKPQEKLSQLIQGPLEDAVKFHDILRRGSQMIISSSTAT